MTKEELKQDANKYAHTNCVFQHIKSISKSEDIIRMICNLVTLTYIHGAESREKQIEELVKETKILLSVAEDWKESCHKAWKENEELKEETKLLKEQLINNQTYENNERQAKLKDKDKIKEAAYLIQDLLIIHNDRHTNKTELSWRMETIDKAEQFVKENYK